MNKDSKVSAKGTEGESKAENVTNDAVGDQPPSGPDHQPQIFDA